jgi:hypothetical protein
MSFMNSVYATLCVNRHTFLLRCKTEDIWPFDLQTDRYFVYDKDAPAESVKDLVAALRETLNSGKTNMSCIRLASET